MEHAVCIQPSGVKIFDPLQGKSA